MIRKMLLLFVLLIATTSLFAQGKYAISFSDYINNQWIALDSLNVESRSQSGKLWGGGADFKPITGNKATDTLLKKQVGFVVYNDTLYVNCHSLKYQGGRLGNWYALGFRFGEDKIGFVFTKLLGMTQAMKTGALGGAIGAIDMLKKRTCYFIESDNKKVKRITKEYMEEILKDSPEWLESYRSVDIDRKESADVIIEYLSKLNLLDKY